MQAKSPNAPGYASQPAAPNIALSPIYGSALANVTAELPVDSLNKVIPKANVNAVVGALMGGIQGKANAALSAHGGGGVRFQLGASLPTGLPELFFSAQGMSMPLRFEGGMTVANILDWCAYLIVRTFADAGVEGALSALGNGNLGIGEGINFGVLLGADAGAGAGLDLGFGGTGGLHIGIGGDGGLNFDFGMGTGILNRKRARPLKV